MPQPTPAPANAPVCGHCDGFPVVAVTTGTRHRDGTRRTVRAVCPACHGTGTLRPAAPVKAGVSC
jgi:DnaJ-class molecular chaperone